MLQNPFRKGKKLYSILKLKCPKCQQGDLFLEKNAYRFKHLDKMPDRCPVCGENFVRETGFYYGAMMVSHATTTAIGVLVHLVIYPFYGWAAAPNLIAIFVVFASLIPWVFRSSRAVWINLFVQFDPKYFKGQ